ncbi:M14 family metallopeptidase [Saccharopolyspora elongata]|uniref:Zinc carboxypeptidase n=1 Tax=Saccharopolyspora elongata TaxID=2530387 RepID=A0A4R4YF13_9PSEU|nr:M14 family metallopeptidase [Saccharopolyspora elongata]TDD42439.1 peptidase M14 [Saccharopolyspora elongata]
MSIIASIRARDGIASLHRLLASSAGLDVWEVKPDHLVVQATEAQADRIQQMGYVVEQLQTTERYLSSFGAQLTTGYHSAESLETDMRQLAERHPEIAEVHEIGRSVENRPILALRIGERSDSTLKMLFLGCHHAREWIAVEIPYLLAEHLLENASSSSAVQSWLRKGEVWVVPMVNPDGHEHTRTSNRLWRKNRARNRDGTVGVDPNRNYGYMWGTLDIDTSSHVPGDETYVGTRAFSEPEVRAVRNLVGRELFSGVLTYHSYSQLILFPWGYTTDPINDTASRQLMEDVAGDMQNAINGVHGEKYTVTQSSGLYPTAGDTTDWTYGEFYVPSLTVELRPQTHAEGGFILPPDQIRPTWEENEPAALSFIGRVFGN